MLFQVRWRSAEGQAMLKHELKRLQKGITTLLEASHYHLLVTPPSHNSLKRLEVGLGGFGERVKLIVLNDSRD